MSVKKFIRERMEKRALIDDLKRAVISGSDGRTRDFDRIDASSSSDVLDLLISVGNVAFTAGEIDVFEYFIDAMFDVVGSGADVNTDELLESVLHFGVMSTYNHDIYSYSIVLENFVEYIFGLREMEAIDSNLRVLRKMALESERKGFDSGVLQVAAALKDTANHLEKEGMQLSRFFLKNHLISMIYAVDKRGNEGLRDDIIEETRGLLDYSEAPPVKEAEVTSNEETQEAPPEQVT
jgi:hypothetical protein